MKEKDRFELTKEGEEYLSKGLPEESLVKIIKGPMEISAVKKKVENFHIALSWAKKNGWVKLEKGKVILIKRPVKVEERDSLEKVKTGKAVPEKALTILLKRNLVFKIKQDAFNKAEKFIGKEVSSLTPELIKTGYWKQVRIRPYDVSVTGEKMHPGKRQPYNRFLSQVRQKLVELGFKEMSGPIIESEFWNFDALFQAQGHPSRDWTQTYSLKKPTKGDLPKKGIVENVKLTHENGWKTGSTGWGYKWDPEKASKLMPRAHGTACSARQLAKGVEVPGKYFAIKRCFRPDVIDATHGVEFNQCEGIIIDKKMTFKNLLGILKEIAIEFTGAEKVKFFPDYYPFTEISTQMSVKHPVLGWIELAGSGIFRDEVTQPLGIKQPVIAWGIGIDRLAMFKLGIHDIRHLFSPDIDWLRKQKVTF